MISIFGIFVGSGVYITVTHKLRKMKITYLIGLLIFPILVYSQNDNSDLKNGLNKIDSIVELTNRTEKNYSEGIAEGPIIYKRIFKKNGKWEAYFLYKQQSENPPIRIKYYETGNKTYEKFEFYYQNKELIFSKLSVKFYRGKRKDETIGKKYYFKNSKLIFESSSELENYNEKYILRTDKIVRKMIYE